MLIVKKLIALTLATCFALSCAFGAALAPAVNSPMLNMAGGTPPSTIWVPTATVAIGTADTSIFSATGQGPGQTITPTTSPVAPYVGNTFSFNGVGVYSTPTVNTATITTKIKWGSTVVASGVSSGLQASATNLQFTVTGTCTIITISATPSASTVLCAGTFTYAQALNGLSVITTSFQSTSPVSVDTTAAFKPDVTMTWSTQGGSPPQAATVLVATDQIIF